MKTGMSIKQVQDEINHKLDILREKYNNIKDEMEKHNDDNGEIEAHQRGRLKGLTTAIEELEELVE